MPSSTVWISSVAPWLLLNVGTCWHVTRPPLWWVLLLSVQLHLLPLLLHILFIIHIFLLLRCGSLYHMSFSVLFLLLGIPVTVICVLNEKPLFFIQTHLKYLFLRSHMWSLTLLSVIFVYHRFLQNSTYFNKSHLSLSVDYKNLIYRGRYFDIRY